MKDSPLNKSGFPLQIALRNAINNNPNWKVLFTEHQWHNDNGESGFIDLVIEDKYKKIVFIIECKRYIDQECFFLNENGQFKDKRRNSKVWKTIARSNDEIIKDYGESSLNSLKYIGWKDLDLNPTSTECQFCIVNAKNNITIEPLASTLVNSTEAYALEEARFFYKHYKKFRFYFNAIVTNAKLKVCEFKPDDILLKDGIIKNPIYHDVNYLRFRKQLNTSVYKKNLSLFAKGHQEFVKAKESTVFIVNSESINDFLNSIEIPDLETFDY